MVALSVSTPCNRLLGVSLLLFSLQGQCHEEAIPMFLMVDCTISEYFSQVLFRDWPNYTPIAVQWLLRPRNCFDRE